MLQHAIKEIRVSMKLCSIRLYRSPLFKIVHFILFLCTLFLLAEILYFFCILDFSKPSASVPEFLSGIEVDYTRYYFRLIFRTVENLLLAIWYIFLLFIFGKALFFNRITVYDKYLFLHFAPRLFFKAYKVNIHSIARISVEDVSFWRRLCSYNFEKEHLYKFTCYNTEYVVSSKDEAGMEKLMAEINPQNNPLESDEADYKPWKLQKDEMVVLLFIADYILKILYFLYVLVNVFIMNT